MKTTLILGAASVTGLVLIAGSLPTADADNRGGIGPDVVASEVGDSTDMVYEGQSGGISAYSIGSTSCNLGDSDADWIDGVGGRNPLIAQNLYRMKNDGSQIEHIGMSWLKQSFCALSQSGDNCSPPCPGGFDCDVLTPGCADTYTSGLNDGASGGHGPRWEVNPVGIGAGQVHDDDNETPSGASQIRGRLQVKQSEIQSGYRYFAEIHYVTHDEDLNRRWNNATYREVNLTTTSISPVNASSSAVALGSPAIQAWADNNGNVTMVAFEDDPNVGRFNLGYLVTDNGNGTWTYEYALHNLNSDRSANRFIVPVPAAVNVTNDGFHDVDYHSNDGWNGSQDFDDTDWPMTVGANDRTWSCANFTTNTNANALRWGSTYNYRFTADTPPVAGNITVGMYKGGGNDTVNVPAMVPDAPEEPVCPADIADSVGDPGTNGEVDVFDLLLLLANWNTGGPGAAISSAGGGSGIVDVFDLLDLLPAWGPCDP